MRIGPKFGVPWLTAVLALTILAGCGSETDSAYCKQVRSAATVLTGLQAGDVASLEDAISTLHELAQAAPDEISAEWKTYDDQLTAAQSVLDEAGIELADLGKIQGDKLPQGLTAQDAARAANEFRKLGSPEVTEATDEIRAHSADVCKVNLVPGSDQESEPTPEDSEE